MDDSYAPKKTVLVVDDNETTRYVISHTLKRAGFEVMEAVDGGQALEMAKLKPDLITLDVKLPDINGLEVCKRIKSNAELSSIPVVHMSATFVQSNEMAHALESGADGYMTHPVEDIVLIATVRAFLRARQAEKDREQLLVQSRKDLEQLRLERELRERFVATLTHDLRTPMTAAKMSASLLMRQPDISDNAQKLAHRITESIDRADRMVRDLLDANRIRAGEPLPMNFQECRLKSLTEDVLADLASSHGDRFVLKAKSETVGYWDCDALQRVIENLVINAIKYGAPFRPIVVTISEVNSLAELSVCNEGRALTAEEQAILFDPYRRTSSAQTGGQKGWGLGLTLVQGVVAAHGGKVSLRSETGKGTTFTIQLPKDSRPFRVPVPPA